MRTTCICGYLCYTFKNKYNKNIEKKTNQNLGMGVGTGNLLVKERNEYPGALWTASLAGSVTVRFTERCSFKNKVESY